MSPRRGRLTERGSVAIEVVMLVPILVLVAMMALQLGVAGWTASQTQEAARQAARAQGRGLDAYAAAQRALPGSLNVDHIGGGGGTVTLRVEVPRVSPLPQFKVTRRAVMPSTS